MTYRYRFISTHRAGGCGCRRRRVDRDADAQRRAQRGRGHAGTDRLVSGGLRIGDRVVVAVGVAVGVGL
jgi:hypothetical protein